MRDEPIEIAGRTVQLSSTDKVFYPDIGVTKGDVVGYYRDVAGVMLPHLRGRPLTLRRFPDGIDASGFYQKQASDYFPDWIDTVKAPRREGQDSVEHAVCNDAAALVYLANQACLEFHVWLSRADGLERPDRLVFDLDPPEEVDLGELRSAARRLRDVLGELGLTPFVQTTGGAGFHIAAPLSGDADFDVARTLARNIADQLAREDPEHLTVEQRKDRRGNRIFLDTNRNAYGQMAVCSYSLRARPGAPVATPIDWSELGRVAPNGYDFDSVRRRLARKDDPWRDLDRHAASTSEALQRLEKLAA